MRGFLTLPTMALAVAMGLAAAHPAGAQINPFRGSFANRLSNDDFQMMGDAANSLLNRDPLAVGASEVWRNPRTGSAGTIEVTRSFKHGSYACNALDYTVNPGGSDGLSTNRTRLNWCKTKAGWRIL